MSSACGSLEGRVGSMKLARLFCGTVAALGTAFTTGIMFGWSRTGAQTRVDAVLACSLSVPTLRFIKLQHKARVRWAGILTPHSFGPVQNSGLQAKIFLR